MRRSELARHLAHALVDLEWHVTLIMARIDRLTDAGGPWLRALAFDLVSHFPKRPTLGPLATFIDGHPAFQTVWRKRRLRRALSRPALTASQMGARPWPVRPLDTERDLALWLGLDDGELEWFADRKGFEVARTSAEPLRHYRRRWLARGARLPRLLEAPKRRLKGLQRAILREILEVIPAHDAAHGFVKGRSPVTHARLHVGRRVVVRFDLQAFFTSVAARRAFGVFRAAGYPHQVAATLLGLCTTQTPAQTLREAPVHDSLELIIERRALLQRLSDWHLPQGAPTSPALANLAVHHLDSRLSGYAEARGWTYSRYADDLVFSSDVHASAGPLAAFVRQTVREEGFRLNALKTKVMWSHQQQRVTGLVVNQRVGLPRRERDALEAVIHRCATRGPAAEGVPLEALKASLQGALSWLRSVDPTNAAPLVERFGSIQW